MVRMVIDIDDGHFGVLATKEAAALALESLGGVRVVQVTEFHGRAEKTWKERT